jgi:hypothetical protein
MPIRIRSKGRAREMKSAMATAWAKKTATVRQTAKAKQTATATAWAKETATA